MGWEDVLLPPLAKLIDLYPNFDAHEPIPRSNLAFGRDRKKVRHLSPNHWEMGISAELLRAAAYGTTEEWDQAVDTYMHGLDLHLHTIGLWTSEQCTGAPHGGFYLVSLMAARMAMRTRLQMETEQEPRIRIFSSLLPRIIPSLSRLIEQLDEYTIRTFAYMHLTSTRTGNVICCGERMLKGPDAPQQSAIYRELNHLPHPNRRQIERQIDDPDGYFWLSLKATRKLISISPADYLISLMKTARDREFPLVARPVHIDRWDSGHRAFYVESSAGKVGKDACRWVWVDRSTDSKPLWGADVKDMPVRPEPLRD